MMFDLQQDQGFEAFDKSDAGELELEIARCLGPQAGFPADFLQKAGFILRGSYPFLRPLRASYRFKISFKKETGRAEGFFKACKSLFLA